MTEKRRKALGDLLESPMAFIYTASGLWATGFLSTVNNFLFTNVWSYSTLALNWAGLLGYIGLLAGYFMNDRDLSEFGDIETTVTSLLLVVHTLISFVPSIRTAITGSTPLAVFILAIYVVGYGVLNGSWVLNDSNPSDGRMMGLMS